MANFNPHQNLSHLDSEPKSTGGEGGTDHI